MTEAIYVKLRYRVAQDIVSINKHLPNKILNLGQYYYFFT